MQVSGGDSVDISCGRAVRVRDVQRRRATVARQSNADGVPDQLGLLRDTMRVMDEQATITP
jgi:hypothetical protein